MFAKTFSLHIFVCTNTLIHMIHEWKCTHVFSIHALGSISARITVLFRSGNTLFSVWFSIPSSRLYNNIICRIGRVVIRCALVRAFRISRTPQSNRKKTKKKYACENTKKKKMCNKFCRFIRWISHRFVPAKWRTREQGGKSYRKP